MNACAQIQADFSSYLDGAIPGGRMQQISVHLEQCAACAREFALARQLQQALHALGPVRPPVHLSRRLRLALSQERTRSWTAVRDRLQMRWENTLRPLVLQASAGLAGAVVLIGGILFLLGTFAVPPAVMANDEPLGAFTAPHFRYSIAEPRAIHTDRDQTIVVQARISDTGRIYDYTILSGPSDPAVRSAILDQLLNCVFQPASVFGGPVRGEVIMTFAGISVRG